MASTNNDNGYNANDEDEKSDDDLSHIDRMTANKKMTILNLKDEVKSLYAHIEGYKKALVELENKLRRSKANEDFEKDHTKFEHARMLNARRERDTARHLLGHCQGQRNNIQALLQNSTQQVAALQQQLANLQQQLASISAPAAGGARKTRRKRRRKRRRRKRKTRRN